MLFTSTEFGTWRNLYHICIPSPTLRYVTIHIKGFDVCIFLKALIRKQVSIVKWVKKNRTITNIA